MSGPSQCHHHYNAPRRATLHLDRHSEAGDEIENGALAKTRYGSNSAFFGLTPRWGTSTALTYPWPTSHEAAMSLLYAFISVYEVIVFVAILSSWIPSENLIFQFVRELTEPVLNPIRKILPAVAGFDFSPMILLLALHALKRVLAAH